MDQPICYVISHRESPVVVDCVASLVKNNWRFEIFPAVVGTKLSAGSWQDIGVTLSQDGKMRQRPGAQGCWMSHWQLWNRCIQSQLPCVILEHDAVVSAPWPQDLDFQTQLIKLYSKAECKLHPLYGQWSKGSHAYCLTPQQAGQLVDFARQHGAQAVDKHLGSNVLPWSFYSQDLVTLHPRRGASSTSSIKKYQR